MLADSFYKPVNVFFIALTCLPPGGAGGGGVNKEANTCLQSCIVTLKHLGMQKTIDPSGFDPGGWGLTKKQGLL